MQTAEVTALTAYVAVAAAIGILSRRGRDVDFVIGGRKVERFGTTMSIFATLLTESLIFFTVSLTARYGPLSGLAVAGGPALALIVLSLVARRAHASGIEREFVCITEYCEYEWGPVTGRFARIILLLLMGWVIVLQINLNGSLLSGLLDWSPVSSTSLVVAVVLLYLTTGGYRAVIRTDAFQGIVLGAMVLLPFVISPKPDLAAALDARFLSFEVLLIFVMSFSLTIVRPELWQRVYSASTGPKAVSSMRWAALVFFLFNGFIAYYALAVVQASPDLSPQQAFVEGYRQILPGSAAAIFPVVLLAAMMSSLDSAAFLLALDLTTLRSSFLAKRKVWTRIFIAILLIFGGLVSLTIFDSLTFAYKLNGVIALLTVPLLTSFWVSIPPRLLALSLSFGMLAYVIQIITGRIDANPVESILGGVVTAITMLVGYGFDKKGFNPKRLDSRQLEAGFEN